MSRITNGRPGQYSSVPLSLCMQYLVTLGQSEVVTNAFSPILVSLTASLWMSELCQKNNIKIMKNNALPNHNIFIYILIEAINLLMKGMPDKLHGFLSDMPQEDLNISSVLFTILSSFFPVSSFVICLLLHCTQYAILKRNFNQYIDSINNFTSKKAMQLQNESVL
jgi:hypothetical protein